MHEIRPDARRAQLLAQPLKLHVPGHRSILLKQ
jgi:hypothetical protein